MFPISITISNAADLAAVMAALGTPLAANVTPPAPSTVQMVQQKDATAGKPRAEKAATNAPSSPTAEVAAADAPAQSTQTQEPQPGTPPATESPAAASSAPEPVTYAQVAKAITDMVKVDRQKVVDTLAKFKVAKGPELKAEQYADFLAALQG